MISDVAQLERLELERSDQPRDVVRGVTFGAPRITSLEKQYLSPGGRWRSCRGDCRDQLRRDTVDFWDYQRD